MPLSFFDIESIRLYGIPVEVDGCGLTLTQAKVLAGMVGKLMDEAGHKKDAAVPIAVEAFRRMYVKEEDGWRCKRTVRLKDHAGVAVRSKFHRQDQKERVMGRIKAEVSEERRRKREAMEKIEEAGARNSKKDKQAILGAVHALFDVLNKADQDEVMAALNKKVGRPVTRRKP